MEQKIVFRKSSFSGVTRNLCVEVATLSDGVLVRNSTQPDSILKFTLDEWQAFLSGVKKNEFDVR